MAKFFAYYKKPKDVEAFERIYWSEHVPLVRKIPGLKDFAAHHVVGSPFGEPELYMVAELVFESPEAMQAGLSTPEAAATVQHAVGFATEGVDATVTVPARQSATA